MSSGAHAASLEQARAAIRDGRLDIAKHNAAEVLRRQPRDLIAIEMLAMIAQADGDDAQAEARAREALSLSPGNQIARHILVTILTATNRAEEAEILLRELVALFPNDDEAHFRLGLILSVPVSLVEGAWHLRRAIAIAGRKPPLLVALARNLVGQGLLGEAEALAHEASALDPGDAVPLTVLVEIDEQRGCIDAALATLGRIDLIGLESTEQGTSARVTLLARGPRWRESLATLDADPRLSAAARLLRGRLREKAGRHDDAWKDFTEGKAMLAEESGRHYLRDQVERHLSAVSRAFSAPFWRDVPTAGARDDVPQPLFVLGFPRSGTTMIEQVLSGHSAIRAGGELPFVSQLLRFCEQLVGRGLSFPAGIGDLAAADFHHVPALLRDFYLARAETHGLTAPGARFFTDKTPLNETYLPLLRLAFPHAPMILVRRHPLDTLVSVMAHDMTHGFNCGYRYADAAHQFAAVSQLTVHYRDVLRLPFHTLRYEQFIADQHGQTARLMAYAGLDLEPIQLRFHESARHAPTPSYAQVKEPVHARSIERWRPYSAHLAPALRLLAPAMADGGYDA